MRGVFQRFPQLGFLMLGALIFALWEVRAHQAPVTVSPELQQALIADHEKELGRALTPAERTRVVDAWVEEEVLFREALAKGLERSDPIVRRRLVQAMRFLLEDEAREPTDAELQDWLNAHREQFQQPGRVTFEHVFVPAGDVGALQQALASGASASALGAPFALGREFDGWTEQKLADTFGAPFAAAVFSLPVNTWAPLNSAYGGHIVRVSRVTPAQLPQLEAVRGQLRSAVRDAHRAQAMERHLAALKARHPVSP